MDRARGKGFVRIAALIIILSLVFSLILPPVAYGRGFLRGLVNFVVRLPERVTRPLGPLAPVARIWLMGKFPKFGRVTAQARRIKGITDDIDAQKRSVAEARKVYREQAADFRKQAKAIRNRKVEIRSILKDCGPGSLRTFIDEYMELEEMARALDKAADNLERRADNLRVRDVVRMFARNTLRAAMGDIKSAAIGSVSKDLANMTDPRLIAGLVENGGINVDDVIGVMIGGELEKRAKANGLSGRLDGSIRKRVVARMKKKLRERRDFVKANWRDELDRALIDIVKSDAGRTKETVRDVPRTVDELNNRSGCGETGTTTGDPPPDSEDDDPGVVDDKVVGNMTFNLDLTLPPKLGPNAGLKLERHKLTIHTIPGEPLKIAGKFEITLGGSSKRVIKGEIKEQINTKAYPLIGRPMDIRYDVLTHPSFGPSKIIDRDRAPSEAFKGSITGPASGSGTLQTSYGFFEWKVVDSEVSARMR